MLSILKDYLFNDNQEAIVGLQKEQLEVIINNMSDGLTVVDAEGNYIINSKSVSSYFGKKTQAKRISDEYESRRYFDESGKQLSLEELPLSRIIKGEKITEYIMRIEEGEEKVYLCINGTPTYNDDGGFSMGIICSRNITMQHMYENMLKTQNEFEMRKNEELERLLVMKDEFLSIVSHEFKTPLTVISSAIQAIEVVCRNELTEKVRSYLAKIRQNSFRLVRLVNNILDLTRVEAGYLRFYSKDMDIVNLTRAIIDSVSAYARNKGIDLTFTTRFSERFIAIDDEKYERILLNLISNAIKFSPRGKTVNIRIYKKQRNICIEVKDEGVGIPKDRMYIIFERFGQADSSLTRQAEGTGIGLCLSKRLANAMGGEILAESEEGKGSIFTVMLPDVRARSSLMCENNLRFNDHRIIQSVEVEFSDIYT